MPRRKRRPKGQFIIDQHRWKLSLLRDYIAKHGWSEFGKGTVVPPGVNLYNWVRARRVDYAEETIADWLVAECEQVPGWSWKVYEEAYRRNLDKLRSFVKKHGWDALRAKRIVDGVDLHRWVLHRREEYWRGRLDKWLVRGLEALPGWTWDPRRESYEEHLRLLRSYAVEHGTTSIPADVIVEGIRIGQWVANVRAMYRRDDLPEWVEAELERIPAWQWEPRRARQQDKLARLAAFVAKHGWERVTEALVVDGVNVGIWISNCRRYYREGTLPDETVAGLEAIPGWSWQGRTTWYQPKDTSGRFIAVSDADRARQARRSQNAERPR